MNRVGWLALVAAVAAAAPAQAQFENGQVTEFGTVSTEPFPSYEGRPLDVAARVTLHEGQALAQAQRIHVSWILVSGGMDVEFTDLVWEDGSPVPLAADERPAGRLRVHVDPQDVRPGQAMLMRARVHVGDTGIYHLGVSVMAFDASYDVVENADGSPAELYGFTQVRNTLVRDGFLRPPLVGQGNAEGVVVFGAALCATAFWGARWAVNRWT